MIIREIKCKSLLNKSFLADYCINCYVGCGHACVYCYANYITKKFSKHKESWGKFVDVKINSSQILIREVNRKKKGSVFVSSLTDPYQPLEKKYELTRKCLEILFRNNFSIWIQTKSSLVTRDIDLFKKFRDKCEITFTITTLNENIRKKFEPFSSSVKEKIDAIKILKENKIKTFVFFGPVLPFLSDENLEEYIKTLSELEIDGLWIDKLNLKPGIWERIEKVLKINYPELIDKWKKILFYKSNYYDELKKKIMTICKKENLKYIFCY